MFRNIINDMASWYETSQEKVLLVKGALGVGKTWSVQDFGSAFFKQTIMIDLSNDGFAKKILQDNLEEFSLYVDTQVKSEFQKSEVLIVFDEVQVMDYDIHGIMEYISTKPGYYFCMIASYMGSLIGEDEYLDSLEVINLMPLTFEEFLIANKAQNLCKYIEKQRVTQVDEVIIQRIIDYLKVFFVVGGMPEIVAEYIKSNDIQGIDKLQKGQLIKYRGYISKKAPKNILEKVLKIWDSIPAQLTKDNRKFMYGYVDEKARAREYESATNWLVDNGLLRRVFKVEKGLVPLKEHIDKKSFELYHLDHGLLRQMKGLNGSKLLARTNLFDAMEGALVEQMVLAELTLNANVKELYFWISGATARIDFLFEDDGEVIPVDVQSTIRTKAQSIKVFQQKYNNRMAIRISLGELNFSKGVLNIPLYGLWNF